MGLLKSIFSKNDEENLLNSGNKKYNQRDFQGAISDFSTLIQLNNLSFPAYYGRALSKYALKDTAGAKEDFEFLYQHKPDYSSRILYYLGKLEAEIKNFQKGIDYFEA